MTTPATPAPSSSDDRPLRVLIGADTFLPHVNGAARFAERLAAGLVRRGHDVTVLEASARTGGHVFTFRDGLDDGLPRELRDALR